VEVLQKQEASGQGWEETTGDEEIVANPPTSLADGQAVR
jgi:hypothetical protein